MLIGHFSTLFGKTSVQILCLFLIRLFVSLLLSYKSSLHIWGPSPLSDVWFTNILSFSVSCLFPFLFYLFACFLSIHILLKYVSGTQQGNPVMHTHILFFRLCSIVGYYKILPVVPWSFHFLDSVLHSTNFYMLMKFNLSVFSLVAFAFLNIILFIYFWLCCIFAAQAFLSWQAGSTLSLWCAGFSLLWLLWL